MAHFGKGLLGSKTGIGGFHGAEFVALKTTVVLSETIVGIDCGGMRVGKLDNKPNDEHRDASDDDAEKADEDVKGTLNDDITAGERGGFDENGGCVADKFEFAKVRRKGGFGGDKIVKQVVCDGLFINIGGGLFVSLEDDVDASVL